MSLVGRLALRDLRRGGRGLFLLALCLFFGTAALAGIGSLSASMIAALDAQGRQMLGGDVELRVSQRRATVEEAAAFAARGPLSETVGMRAMADAERGDAPVLVALKGVDARWPLIGDFRLQPGALAPRPAGLQAAIAPALADRLGVKVGDRLRVGAARLTVIGIIATEPDALGEGFSLGPRVLVDMAGLDATAAVQPGSLYDSRYRLLLPVGANAKTIGDGLSDRFPGAGWSTRTPDQAAGGLRRGIAQLGQFLLLVGLSALAIAGVGVGSGVAAYLAGKTRIIAMLKVLGAESRTIAAIFLTQLAAVAAIGIALGLIVGAAVPAIVTGVAGDALPVVPRLALYPVPLLTAAALSALVALLFALPALARARRVPAASLLRDVVANRRWPSLRTAAAMTGLLALLVALAVLTASDRILALGFVAAMAVLVALLWGIGIALRRGLARLPRPRRPLLRLALANLHRPGAQTDRLVVALGLGFALFVALATIDTSLSSEMASRAPAKAPRFFAIDLQPDDAPAFRTAVTRAAPGARIEATPSLRGSIVALKGQSVADMKTVPEGAWVLRGDRTITWAKSLPPRNEITAGRWWPADYRGPPLVSIEDRAAEALGLRIGDEITVAVLGVDVTARIAATRKIDWSGLGLNFAIVFSPGLIEEAPHSLLASVYAPPGGDGAIARDVARALPSVTMIRVGDVIGQIGELLGQIALAIRVAAAVTVAAGLVVLVGAIAASARARRTDAVILKLLGGSSGQVLGVQAIEYALLSALLTGVALAVGGVAGWYVVTQVFSLGWAPDWSVVALTLAASAIVTLGIGVLGNLPLLRTRPAAALRAD
ncbi:FtsX-like permease family protein [Sphingomonas sp. SUN019]|uniref:ABC transporter permease n=1 Tax=Sphingomonas sp. SUN019 TaxID=2937788 RepID=UPI00216494C0|nr:FtsX-like permease family protein [Sphingomonas sp. SUN019]UVO51565.1 FtsX-like permease family protein [Sphingomonas sp. SUN019]